MLIPTDWIGHKVAMDIVDGGSRDVVPVVNVGV